MDYQVEKRVTNLKKLQKQLKGVEEQKDTIESVCSDLFIDIVKLLTLKGLSTSKIIKTVKELNLGYIDNLDWFIEEYRQLVESDKALFR